MDLYLLISIFCLTGFVKLVFVLTTIRYGLGLYGGGLGVVVIGLALVLSLVNVSTYISLSTGNTNKKDLDFYLDQIKPLAESNTDLQIKDNLNQLAIKHAQPNKQNIKAKPDPNIILSAAFLLTELRKATELALYILLPFLVIDILTAHSLTLMGIAGLSVHLVSMPLKLVLFIALDGWNLILSNIISGYIP